MVLKKGPKWREGETLLGVCHQLRITGMMINLLCYKTFLRHNCSLTTCADLHNAIGINQHNVCFVHNKRIVKVAISGHD